MFWQVVQIILIFLTKDRHENNKIDVFFISRDGNRDYLPHTNPEDHKQKRRHFKSFNQTDQPLIGQKRVRKLNEQELNKLKI